MQSSELSEYLSSGNIAVLPDYVWAECYKQASLPAVQAFMSVIRHFPEQITVLRPGKDIAGLDPRTHCYAEAFELPGVAADLRSMQIALAQAERGSPEILEQLREKWDDANSVMANMLEGAEKEIMPSLPELAAMFTADELGRCRRKEKHTSAMTQKVFGTAFGIYEQLTEIDGRLPMLAPRYAVQTFYYRFALGTMIHCIWWIQNGNQRIARLERLRNDYIDLGLAVCATYYDGLMTGDAKASWMHRELANALRFAEACAAES